MNLLKTNMDEYSVNVSILQPEMLTKKYLLTNNVFYSINYICTVIVIVVCFLCFEFL